MTERGSSAGH